MKVSIKIVVCVFLVIAQVCLLKVAYDKGKQDNKKQTEFFELEVHKIS